MDDLITFLLGLACVLAVVTVVGHGIWVLLATLVQAIDRSNTKAKLDDRKPCPNCGAQFGVARGRCVVCGEVPRVTPRSSLREELLATARQVKRLQTNGVIRQEQYDELAAVLSRELQALGVAGQIQKPAAPASPLPAMDEAVIAELIDEPGSDGGMARDAAPAVPPSSAASSPFAPLPNTNSPEEFVVLRSNVGSQANLAARPAPAATSSAAAIAPAVGNPFATGSDGAPGGPALSAPAPPRPKLSDMLQSFLEESNIRWGEILAGFFIVISSIGLVISLRSTLERIPYFPALLFTGFTVAFHGAGLYTLKRWNLRAVSRVVLVISLLLVPLTASAAVLMSRRGTDEAAASAILFWVVLAVGTTALTWVAYTSSRELVGGAKWRLTTAVVGCALAEVLVHRLDVARFSFWQLITISAWPLGCFLAAVVGQVLVGRRWKRISWPRAEQTFLMLGISLFAFMVTAGMLLMKAEPRWLAAARLAPAFSLAAGATMALGLLIHRRATARSLAGVRTAGTVIVILAGAVLVLTVVLAWPDPELLLAVGIVNAGLLLTMALVADLPLLHAPAVACLALTTLMGLHWAQGRFDGVPHERLGVKIIESALMGRSSLALLALGIAAAAVAEVFRRKHRADDARVLIPSCGGLAALGVFVALFSGFITIPAWTQDRDLAAPLLLVYAGALLVAAPRTPWPRVAGAASALLFAALLQAFAFNTTLRDALSEQGWWPSRTLLATCVAHALVSGALLLAAVRHRVFGSAAEFVTVAQAPLHRTYVEPLAWGAAVSLVAAVPLLFVGRAVQMQEAAVAAGLLAIGWLAVVLTTRWKLAVAGLQAMLLVAPMLAVGHFWHARLGDGWIRSLDHAAMQCVALALGASLWPLLRRLTGRRNVAADLLHADWPAVDELALGLTTFAVAALAWSVTLPLIAWELGYDEIATPLLTDSAARLLSPAAWTGLAAAAVLFALMLSLVERVRLLPLVGLAIAALALVASAALRWESVAAVASATRWWEGAYTIFWGSVFVARAPIRQLAHRLGWLRWSRVDRQTAHATFGAMPMVLGALPILALTTLAVWQSATGVEMRGPAAGSFFDRIGPTTSYGLPLLAIVGVLFGYAIREREAAFALGGSGVFQLAVNLAFLLHVTYSPAQPSQKWAAEWLQWNTIAAGGYALAWLALLRWMLPEGGVANQSIPGRRAGGMLAWQVGLGGAGALGLALWSAASVAWLPQWPTPERLTLGGALSYVGIVLVCCAAAWLARIYRAEQRFGLGNVSFALLAGVVAIAAATVDRYDAARDWLAYHVLTAGWLTLVGAGAAILCLAPKQGVETSRKYWLDSLAPWHGLLTLLCLPIVLLAVRGNLADPGQPWWSLAACLGPMLALTAIGLRRGSQPYAYGSIVLAALAMVLFWVAPAQATWRAFLGSDQGAVFVEALTVAILVAAVFWLCVEVICQTKRNRSFDTTFPLPRSHGFVIVGLLPLYLLWRSVQALLSNTMGHPFSYDDAAGIIAVCVWTLLLVLALWDRRALFALPSLFVWLALVALLGVSIAAPVIPKPVDRAAVLTLSAGLVAALAGQAWSYGANLSLIGLRLGISDPISGLKRTERWLPAISLIITAACAMLTLVFVLILPRHDVRIAVAFAPAAAAWGLACLADDERRPHWRLLALLTAGLSAIYLAWAQLGIEMSGAMWLTRSFRLLMMLSVLTFIYGLALPRWLLTTGKWNEAARKAGYLAGAAAIAAFIGVLVLEASLFRPGVGAPVDSPQVVAIAVVLVVLIAGLVSMALLPGRDPLLLTEKGRQIYVYGALATGVLLFAHLYVCRPMWFDAGLLPYWPLIVMGIAFAGAGGSELFFRYRLNVLAEPLLRVSSMLPLLPVLGMWIVAPKETDYALVLLIVGLLYLMLSVTQRSWASLLAAVVAANGALWSLLNRTGLDLVANPQLWLIPPAVSVLLAAHVNRRRLPAAILTSIRYACTLLIYVSSTSEIFLRGMATSLWPAMVLATLSVIGVFVGMMLRIRAFLYLGASFALVSLITMVAHAAQAIDHVWPWWAFGVGMGIAILVLLGIFEKQREEVLRLIARLREWEQ